MASSTTSGYGSGSGARDGITLLEVLISCGLLLVGLTAMASMLPAAGSRLSQASIEDRAAVLLSNAIAEMFNRGLVAADTFPSLTSGTTGVLPAVAIGKVLGGLPTFGVLPSGRAAADFFVQPSDEGRTRCGSSRTFLLEDALAFGPPQVADTPTNAFLGVAGSPGPRDFRQGICWGATLAPGSLQPEAGDAAELAIAIFKRDDASGEATQAVPLVLSRFKNCYESEITPNGSLLRACSWVLAVPTVSGTPARRPAWFKIMSSWTWRAGESRTTRLIVGDQQAFESLTDSAATGATALVFAFEDLVRVDVQTVTLQ